MDTTSDLSPKKVKNMKNQKSKRSRRMKRAWQIANKYAKEQGGSPVQYIGQAQRDAAGESRKRSERMKKAWRHAKLLAKEQGGEARDYLGETQKIVETEEIPRIDFIPLSPDDVVIPYSMLPDMPYYGVLKRGGEFSELLRGAMKFFSRSFWMRNQGKGGVPHDWLTMKALNIWLDGEDYTVSDVMRMYQWLIDRHFGAGRTEYIPEINKVVIIAAYNTYLAQGGDMWNLL